LFYIIKMAFFRVGDAGVGINIRVYYGEGIKIQQQFSWAINGFPKYFSALGNSHQKYSLHLRSLSSTPCLLDVEEEEEEEESR